MVNFLDKELELDEEFDEDDILKDWEKFPRFVCKVMFANTYLYTSILEIS